MKSAIFTILSLSMISLFILIGKGALNITKISNPRNFKAVFPIHSLRPGPELIDPQNTNTVWEYYLLENLSCGLIRDSKNSTTGYEGCIADRFYRSDPNTWIFILRNLRWSDNSSITKFEIEEWLNNLKSKQSRHIQFLKTADEIEYDENSRELKIHFPTTGNEAVLHELSLADASLYPSDYAQNGWKKTVGPYSVKSWSKGENKLILEANPNSPLYNKNMPQVVEAGSLIESDDMSRLFSKSHFDLVPLNAMSDSKTTSELIAGAPQIYNCHPTTLLYFNLNKANKLTDNLEARRAFAEIIQLIQNDYSIYHEPNSALKIENQMIPEGFQGRTAKRSQLKVKTNGALSNTKLRINLLPFLQKNQKLISVITEAFHKSGVNLEIQYSKSLALGDSFGGMTTFVGNQLDPSGSWSFLLYSAHRSLHPWLPNLEYSLRSPPVGLSQDDRQKFYLRLHEQVLNNYFVVPFLMGEERYLFSDRVDASGWNRFDARVRFYELKMK